MDKLTTYQALHRVPEQYRNLRVGWTVRISQKVQDKDKVKSQIFEGMIIARKHGNEPGATITVRKVSAGTGVEKTIPLALPTIEKIEVVKRAKVRRAKLLYLREKSAREIRKKTKQELSQTASRESQEPAEA